MRPLFLLSLPRSGSTLVQRVLAAHPRVTGTSEPHVLLPLAYALRPDGARAEYWHELASEAQQDFVGALPAGLEDWARAVRAYAHTLYTAAAGADADYYVDKTPRYALIAPELLEVFPDARFVVLWRNPLAVVASCLETFRAGRFEPYHFAVDLYTGLDRLVAAVATHGDRIHAVRYEDLLEGPAQWKRLFEALELEWDPTVLERFADTVPAGRYADPTGSREYAALSRDPAGKWQRIARSRVRRAWLRRYLDWLGADRAAVMGYDLAALRAELDAVPVRAPGARDAVRLLGSRRALRRRQAALALAEGPVPIGDAFAP